MKDDIDGPDTSWCVGRAYVFRPPFPNSRARSPWRGWAQVKIILFSFSRLGSCCWVLGPIRITKITSRKQQNTHKSAEHWRALLKALKLRKMEGMPQVAPVKKTIEGRPHSIRCSWCLPSIPQIYCISTRLNRQINKLPVTQGCKEFCCIQCWTLQHRSKIFDVRSHRSTKHNRLQKPQPS